MHRCQSATTRCCENFKRISVLLETRFSVIVKLYCCKLDCKLQYILNWSPHLFIVGNNSVLGPMSIQYKDYHGITLMASACL
jgi:hypothetical protein